MKVFFLSSITFQLWKLLILLDGFFLNKQINLVELNWGKTTGELTVLNRVLFWDRNYWNGKAKLAHLWISFSNSKTPAIFSSLLLDLQMENWRVESWICRWCNQNNLWKTILWYIKLKSIPLAVFLLPYVETTSA